MAQLVFEFEVDDEGNFEYTPENTHSNRHTWDYKKGDTIKVRTKSGRFAFRFVQVDAAGEPIPAPLSPLKPVNNVRETTIRSANEATSQKFFETPPKDIEDDPEVMAAGVRANVDKVAGYRYSIACERHDTLFTDATHGGDWVTC